MMSMMVVMMMVMVMIMLRTMTAMTLMSTMTYPLQGANGQTLLNNVRKGFAELRCKIKKNKKTRSISNENYLNILCFVI